MDATLILPSEIPWDKIKGKDLEELLYWLFDSMGAKELEWRVGGQSGGAPDQGRDLELVFYSLSPEGSYTKQSWWVEAKGRSGTVEASEVHKAVHNASGKKYLDVLVIATNSVFSNPTRDWVKEWQESNPRPIVKLWERTQLENLCSKNPLAVIRLYSKALSPQGQVEVISSKLWEYVSYTDAPLLQTVWAERTQILVDSRSLLALAVSEIANGDVTIRTWASIASDQVLADCICSSLVNLLYLAFRASDRGVREEPIIKAIAYLIQVAVVRLGIELTQEIINTSWESVDGQGFPQDVRNYILEPVLETIRHELMDVCGDDCLRVFADPMVLTEKEINAYWLRFGEGSDIEPEPERQLRIENKKRPCKVGLSATECTGCPLCSYDKPHESIREFLGIIGEVMEFRMKEEDV